MFFLNTADPVVLRLICFTNQESLERLFCIMFEIPIVVFYLLERAFGNYKRITSVRFWASCFIYWRSCFLTEAP